MTCTCGRPTEGGHLLCDQCARARLAVCVPAEPSPIDLEDDAMPPLPQKGDSWPGSVIEWTVKIDNEPPGAEGAD